MIGIRQCTLILASSILSTSLFAADPSPTPPEKTDAEAAVEKQKTRDFAGIRLGVGLSFSLALGSGDRVESAEVVNGIVRVTQETSAEARIMLETHYFITKNPCKFLRYELSDYMCGVGPFVAIQPGTNELISSIGGGLMFGFRFDEKSSDSFNIGVGIVCDPRAKFLGDGLEANRPLPEGDSLRFKQRPSFGALVIASFSF